MYNNILRPSLKRTAKQGFFVAVSDGEADVKMSHMFMIFSNAKEQT